MPVNVKKILTENRQIQITQETTYHNSESVNPNKIMLIASGHDDFYEEMLPLKVLLHVIKLINQLRNGEPAIIANDFTVVKRVISLRNRSRYIGKHSGKCGAN